ncbi:hypothetical protein F4777DRAFT_118676 [Nemania sp. FL0916]|nr:hypothetical protein F4777DRAFT_118676 [Nemania sp. FL0916]
MCAFLASKHLMILESSYALASWMPITWLSELSEYARVGAVPSLQLALAHIIDYTVLVLHKAFEGFMLFITHWRISGPIFAIVLLVIVYAVLVQPSLPTPINTILDRLSPFPRYQIEHTPVSQETRIRRQVKKLVSNWNSVQELWLRTRSLAKGASRDQIQGLCQSIGHELPTDYKLFLQVTDGLGRMWDGCGYGLAFASVSQHQNLLIDQHLMMKFVDSVLGHGSGPRLRELGLTDTKSDIRVLKIAAYAYIFRGLYLISPKDCRVSAGHWSSFLQRKSFPRDLQEEMAAHAYFRFNSDANRILSVLRNWRGWLVLQVQPPPFEPRIWPSFTAYLETLVDVTSRRRASGLAELQKVHNYNCYSHWIGITAQAHN